MGRTLSEQKVLKKLGIDDFRHLTKDKVISMASMLDKMDPEVAKKAIEQFPDFSNTMKEVFAELKSSLDAALVNNAESVQSFYETCDTIIESCKDLLDKEELSFEEKNQIIEKMISVATIKGEKDSENKRFLIAMGTLGVVAVTALGGILLAAIGGRFLGDGFDNNDAVDIDDYEVIN